jgi:hypothetical protein
MSFHMFRASLKCSSSGGYTVYIQHMVLSLCKQFVVACRCTDRPPRTLAENDSTICCMYTVYPPEDEHLRLARNM